MNNRTDILNELNALSPILFQLKEKEVLPKVPANYFADLSAVVLNKIEVADELKSISEILLKAKQNETQPIVPINYFSDLADNIIVQTQSESTILSSIKKEVEVPNDYFNSFADNVMTKIKAKEQTIAEEKIIALQPQKKQYR